MATTQANELRNIQRPFNTTGGAGIFDYSPSVDYTLDSGLLNARVTIDDTGNNFVVTLTFIDIGPATSFISDGRKVRIGDMEFNNWSGSGTDTLTQTIAIPSEDLMQSDIDTYISTYQIELV